MKIILYFSECSDWLTASEFTDKDDVLSTKIDQLAGLMRMSKKTIIYSGILRESCYTRLIVSTIQELVSQHQQALPRQPGPVELATCWIMTSPLTQLHPSLTELSPVSTLLVWSLTGSSRITMVSLRKQDILNNMS